MDQYFTTNGQTLPLNDTSVIHFCATVLTPLDCVFLFAVWSLANLALWYPFSEQTGTSSQ